MSQPEQDLFQAVILRAICDALGFTNESKSKKAHAEAVKEAREWFYEAGTDFADVCGWAGYDPDRVKNGTVKLIEARQSGDHSNIPTFWREAFRNNRMPSFTAFADAIDDALRRS